MPIRRTLTAVALSAAAALALAACSAGAPAGSATQKDDFALVTPGTLTVATEGTYRPFSYHDESGELVGYDVEIAEAVGEKLGLKVQFQETQWDAIFAGLDAGRFDVIANQVSINPDREKKYLFSEPYTVSRGVVVVNSGDDTIAALSDLAGKKTAQSLTSNWYQLAQSNGATVEAVEGWAQAVTLLKQGRVDATINDDLTFLDYAKTNGDSGLKVAAKTDDPARNAFALKKDRAALTEAIDGALAALQADGTLARISEKYFGADVTR